MFGKLTHFYWYIRYYSRNNSKKRKYYRYVATEKKRLIESGVDAKYLRLYCRSLSGRHNTHAEKRLENYQKQNAIIF